MVLTYLLDSKQKLVEERIDLRSQLQKIQTDIRENEKLSHFIKDSENNSYASFVPSNYKNDLNAKHIQELQEKRSELEEKSKYFQLQIKITEERMEELNYIIKLVKQERQNTEDLQEELKESEQNRRKTLKEKEQEKNKLVRSMKTTMDNNMKTIVSKLEMCTKIVELDPGRCKIELQDVLKEIKNM